MFKKILLILLLVIPAGVAMADDYPYFAFQTSNGETKTLSVTGLKITFSNGNIVATNEEALSRSQICTSHLPPQALMPSQSLSQPKEKSTMFKVYALDVLMKWAKCAASQRVCT